jgi:hypothetical protein
VTAFVGVACVLVSQPSGQVIGPGVAGLLAAAGLLRGTMLIDALSFGVSLASLAALRGG